MILEEIDNHLANLDKHGLRRRRKTLETPCGVNAIVDGKKMLSFCSNDYLGLAAEPILTEAACAAARQWGIGSGSSHLVSGHMSPHEKLERDLATFSGCERALFFSTGYMANLGVVPALAGRGDAIFADRLNHASLIDAAQISRADHHRYPHNDLAVLERLLKASNAKNKLILTDAVFSMDGDLAPLPELLELAERFDAWLVVDDAHGFGVLGPKGHGSFAHFGLTMNPRVIYIGTLGKAAGVSGAFAAGADNVIEWLLQQARTYIFTTASSPVIAAALSSSLALIEQGEDRRRHLQALIARLRQGLATTRWRLMPSFTAIQPLVIGTNDDALRIASALADHGIWVPAIRPPTVPKGTARLRISLSAAHRFNHIDQLCTVLEGLQ